MKNLLGILDAFLFGMPNSMIILIIELAVSLIICLFGYRMLRTWGSLLGFIIGASIGTYIAEILFKNDILTLIIAVVAGFFLGMLSFHIYSLGLFLSTFFFGSAFAAQFGALFINERNMLLIVTGAAGLIVAIICLIFLKPVIIPLTALFGGFKAARYAIVFIPLSEPWVLPALSAILVAVGAGVQFVATSNYKVSRGGDVSGRY